MYSEERGVSSGADLTGFLFAMKISADELLLSAALLVATAYYQFVSEALFVKLIFIYGPKQPHLFILWRKVL